MLKFRSSIVVMLLAAALKKVPTTPKFTFCCPLIVSPPRARIPLFPSVKWRKNVRAITISGEEQLCEGTDVVSLHQLSVETTVN